MKKFIILFCLWMIPIIEVGASPIGCEAYGGGIIRCWGNSSIEPITFISTDSTQFANNVTSRFNWLSYEMGLFYNNSGVINKYPLVFSPSSAIYDSDNQTYWRITWYKNISQGGKSINGTLTMSQSMTDDYVNMTFTTTLWGFDTFPHDLNLYRWMKNIDVWEDGQVDVLNVWVNEDTHSLLMNTSVDKQNHNISRWLTIASMNGSQPLSGGVRWLFGDEYEAYYKAPSAGELNGEVAFYKSKPAPYPSGTTYSVTHYWIDANPCVTYCAFGCSLYVQDNVSSGWNYINQSGDHDDGITAKCRWGYTCGIGSGTCNLVDCYLSWLYKKDTSKGYRAWETYPDYEEYLNNAPGYGGSTRYNPMVFAYYTRRSLGIKPSEPTPKIQLCAITERQPASKASDINVKKYGSLRVYMVNQSKNSNITLTQPVNYYNATPGETINLNCTREEYWSDWLGLYINNSLIYNLTSQGFENLTYSYDPPSTGIYEWDCRAMYYGQAQNNWSWNGNYTWNYTYISPISPAIALFKYWFIDRSL